MRKNYFKNNTSDQSNWSVVVKFMAIVALLFGGIGSANAQTCTETASASGQDCSAATATISSFACVPAGGVVTAVTLDASIGGVCTSWYAYSIVVNGTTVATQQCNQTGFNLTPYLPITSIAIIAVDNDSWCDNVTMNMTANISYVTGPCSGTPNAGSASAFENVVCPGELAAISLSGQSAATGLSYQWQSSTDGVTFTNMLNDTLISTLDTINTDMYYRCEVTCSNSGLASYSMADTVLLGTCASSAQVCNPTTGGTSTVSITGWVGVPTTAAVVTFDYEGDLSASFEFLTVTDLNGNFITQLNGPTSDCVADQDTAHLSITELAAMLTAGGGNIDFVVTATNNVNNFCGPNNNSSFCITASIVGASHLFIDDAAVKAMVTPQLYACVMDSVVSIELKNNGSAALTSVNLNWSVNGMIQPSVAWTGSVASLGFDTVTVGTFAGGFSNFDSLVVWTTNPNGAPIDSSTLGDTLTTILHEAFGGTFTVDPTVGQGDFNSFTEAMVAFETYGICSAVVLESVDTTYIEQMNLSTAAIPGISSVNNITFTSASGNASGVVISYLTTSFATNWVMNLDGAKYIGLKNITIEALGTSYSRVFFSSQGGMEDFTLEGCIVTNQNTSSTSTNQSLMYVYGTGAKNVKIVDNTFINGSYAIRITSSASSDNEISGNEIRNCIYAGIYVGNSTNLVVKNNNVVSNSSYTFGYGIYVYTVSGGGEFSGNLVRADSTTQWPRYGMYLNNIQGDLTKWFPVYNNRVVMANGTQQYAMYIYNNFFVEYSFNSIYKSITGTGTNRGMYFTNGGYNKVFNNNIQVEGSTGIALYVNSSNSIHQSDNNNLSAADKGFFSGNGYATLADWTMTTGFDSNSVVVNEVYSDTATLKVCNDSLYAVGQNRPGFTMDYEGDLRQDPPCIGADEFLPISQFGFDNDPVLCNGDTIILRQDYFDLVVWDTIDTSNVFVVTSSGSHSVAVYDACGSDTSQFLVSAQEMPELNDTNLCEGTMAVLNTGIPNGTYMWSNGSTDSTVTVDSAQTLTVDIVDAFGCVSSDTSVVTQSYNVELPAMDSFCTGLNTVLTANVTGSYLWSTGESTSFISVSTAGSYTVTVTDLNCESNSTTNVIEKLDAIPSFTDSSDHYTVVFTNTSQFADVYSWDFGDGQTSNMENPIHVYPYTGIPVTNYVVTLTATNFCGDVDFIAEEVRAGELVSVSNIELASMINVYPNPNNGIFNVVVKTDEAADLNIEVLDVRGAVVFTQSFGVINGEVNRTVSLEGAAQGVYFVRVTLNDQTAVYKLSVN